MKTRINSLNIITLYIFIQPLFSFLYYYFKLKPASYIGYLFLLILSLFYINIMVNKRKINIKNFLWIMTCFFVILLLSVINSFGNEHSSEIIFLKHFLYFSIFLCLFYLGTMINLYNIFLEINKYVKYLLFIDFMIIIIFKLDLLNNQVYPSFEASYLIPTFILSLIQHNLLMIFFHVILFILHEKRADLLILFIIMLIYLFRNNLKLLFIFLMLFIILLFSIDIETFLPNRFSEIVSGIKYFEPSMSSSFYEKYLEILNSFSQLKTNLFYIIFGNGFGWSYKLDDLIGEGYTLRDYTHFSFYFIFLCFGFIGVAIFFLYHLYLFYRLNKYLVNEQNYFCLFLLLFYFLNSFSVLNIITNPIYILLLGSCFTNLKRT